MTIFISHSSKDVELVTMFCELLTEKLRFDEDDIFCTSLNNSLKVGKDFITSIRDNLQSRDIAIFLITENYKNSMFCTMEMGAAWAFKDNIVPIIVPPLDFSYFDDTPLKTVQAMRLNNADDIITKFYELVLCKGLGYKRLSSERENAFRKYVDRFVEQVNDYAQRTFNFNFDKEKLIPIAQNGNPRSITITQNDAEYVVSCDFHPDQFYPIMSNFMSCVLQLNPHKNWSNTDLNWGITFEACSEDNSITDMILEIKSGDTILKVYEHTFRLTSEYQRFSVTLSETKIPNHHLKQISELCFVIRPHFVPQFSGTMKLRNIHGSSHK